MKRRIFIMSFAAGCALTALPSFAELKRPVVDWGKPVQTIIGDPFKPYMEITINFHEPVEVRTCYYQLSGNGGRFENGDYFRDGRKSLFDVINVGDSIEYWADTYFDTHGKEVG